MKKIVFILTLIVCFSCKNEKQNIDIFSTNSKVKVIEDSTNISSANEIKNLTSKRNTSYKPKAESRYSIKKYNLDEVKDTLVNFEYLKFEIDYSFNYDEYEKNIIEDQAIFTLNNDSLVIVKHKFNKADNNISYDNSGYVFKINDKDAYGIDGNLPNEAIESISFSSKKVESIDKDYFIDLFEPNFYATSVFRNNNEIIIQKSNSDGAGGYLVTLFIDNLNNVRRIIAVP
jgi:hypothetical protein